MEDAEDIENSQDGRESLSRLIFYMAEQHCEAGIIAQAAECITGQARDNSISYPGSTAGQGSIGAPCHQSCQHLYSLG